MSLGLDDLFDANLPNDWQAFGGAHAESVQYWPNGVSANAIPLQVVFDRAAQERVEGNLVYFIKAYVSLDPANTVGVASVNPGADQIVMSRRIGDTPAAMNVASVIDSDASGFTLRLM